MLKKIFSFVLIGLFALATTGLSTVFAETVESPVRDGSTYLGRAFNASYDRMFDDFTRDFLDQLDDADLTEADNDQTAVDLTDRDGYLEVPYHFLNEVGTTKDTPVYKLAAGANSTGSYQHLVFEMRGLDGASIEDLVLSFRYDDNYQDIDVPFTELISQQGNIFDEFTGDFDFFEISISDSLDGKTYEGLSGHADVQAGLAMVGFHLLAADGAGTIQIKSIYYANGDLTQTHMLDSFDRQNPNATAPGLYWNGTHPNAYIVGTWLAFDYTQEDAYYRTVHSLGNSDDVYTNVVLGIRSLEGDEDLLITPIYSDDTTGTQQRLSELYGPDEELLPAITSGLTYFVINFEASDWNQDVVGFEFSSPAGDTGLLYLTSIFYTNMETDATVIDKLPVIDPSDIKVFDYFNRETAGVSDGFAEDNPVALEREYAYILSYAGLSGISVSDGALVLDADAEGVDYINYKAAGDAHANEDEYAYVVFKLKGENDASLNQFRFGIVDAAGNTSTVRWGHSEFFMGSGLPTPALGDASPYVNSDGWLYLVIHLEASQLPTTGYGFDLYYGGSGQLIIDAIFWANALPFGVDVSSGGTFDDFEHDDLDETYWWHFGENVSIVDNALRLDASENAYTYFRGAKPSNNKDFNANYLEIRMKGSEGATLESFRMKDEVDGDHFVFANSGALVDPFGNSIMDQPLTTEFQTYIIDLEASGLPTDSEGITLAFGSWAEGIFDIDYIAYRHAYQPNLDALEDASEPYVVSIEITQLPTKLTYQVGDSFETTGLVVRVTYSDYTSGTLSADDYEVSVDLSVVGTQEVTVSYEEFEDAFEVTVTEDDTQEPGTDPSTNDSNTVLIIVIVIASILVIAGGVVAYIFVKKRRTA